MPHFGQYPGFSARTSACMGQVNLPGGMERGTAFSDLRISSSRRGSGLSPILVGQVRENCALLDLFLGAITNRWTLGEDST